MTIVGRVPADVPAPRASTSFRWSSRSTRASATCAARPRRAGPLHRVDDVSPAGTPFRVAEVLLVHDCGPDDSAQVMRELEQAHPFVRAVWLSRNFGQHAATLAGMASSGGDWIVTIDEDGQHDPAYIGAMLDVALDEQASVVYARPTNTAAARRAAQRDLARRQADGHRLSGGADASVFHSYRLILGEVGRSVAAYAGAGVYLDIALGWVAGRVTTAPVELRDEGEDAHLRLLRCARLLSHFWRMVLTGGTRGLRLVSVLGLVFALLGAAAGHLHRLSASWSDPVPAQGWTSLIVVLLISTGAILFSLGVIAEYVGVAVNMAMGKPLYLITQDPADGPLGRRRPGPDPRGRLPGWSAPTGLLGSAVCRRPGRAGPRVRDHRCAVGRPATQRSRRCCARPRSCRRRARRSYWCAGAGVVGSSQAELDAEVAVLEGVPDALAARSGRPAAGSSSPRRPAGCTPAHPGRRSPSTPSRPRSRRTAGRSCARRSSRPTSPHAPATALLVGRLAEPLRPRPGPGQAAGTRSRSCAGPSSPGSR